MKLVKLAVSKTRTTSDSISLQKNGRVRISRSLAEKMDWHEGDSVDLFTDEENKQFLYVCKGESYKLFRHVRNSNSALYFGSAAIFKELGIENFELHTLTSKLMKLKEVLYLQLDLSEMLPKEVLKPLQAQEEVKKEEVKPGNRNSSRGRNSANNNKEDKPVFIS